MSTEPTLQELEGSIQKLEESLQVILPEFDKCILKKISGTDVFYTDGMAANAIAKLEIYQSVVDRSRVPDCLFRTSKYTCGYIFSRKSVLLTPHTVQVYKAIIAWLEGVGEEIINVSK